MSMKKINDTLDLKYNISRNDFKGFEAFAPLLELLKNSFLPKPDTLAVTDKKSVVISGYLDEKIIKALNKKKHAVQLIIEKEGLEINLVQTRTGSIIGIHLNMNFFSCLDTESITQFFVENARVILPDFGSCHLSKHSKLLFDKYYGDNQRSFFCPGLKWLNFFGPSEEEKQGGKVLERNSFAKVQRYEQGLFLQVGDDPFNCLTNAGEELLVKATNAMPPIE